MLIQHNKAPRALELLRKATQAPPDRQAKTVRMVPVIPPFVLSASVDACPPWHRLQKVNDKVYRSKRLWCLLLDLEENLSPLEDLRNAYDRCIDLRVASAQV